MSAAGGDEPVKDGCGQLLYQFLSRIDRQQVVRISTDKGSNFIYIGKVCDMDLNILDKEIKKWHIKTIINADKSYKRAATSDDIERRKVILLKYIEGWLTRKPLFARIVTDVSRGDFEPEHLLIRIEGSEGWVEYAPEIKPLEELNPEGANLLVSAIYEQAAKDLMCGHSMARSKDERKRSDGWRMVNECKKFFREDPFAQLNDSEWIIEECKMKGRYGQRRYAKK